MRINQDTFLFYDVDETVTAFSTRRHGGVSKGLYESFNVNHYCGDDPKDVLTNRQMLCDYLRIPMDRLVIPHQTHHTEVRQIDESFLKQDTSVRQQLLEGVDAVITEEKNVCIGVSTADCIPIILYDKEHHACGAVHAGWRGTVARIVQHTLKVMNETFATDPAKVKAVIGPGISLQAFEVGQEVYDAFADAAFSMEKIARKYEKWHLDLPLCNRLQMMDVGVPDNQIHDAAICTYHHTEDFFSARRMGIHSGRIFTAIVLRNGQSSPHCGLDP